MASEAIKAAGDAPANGTCRIWPRDPSLCDDSCCHGNELVRLVFERGLGLLGAVDEDADHERNTLSMRCADIVLGV